MKIFAISICLVQFFLLTARDGFTADPGNDYAARKVAQLGLERAVQDLDNDRNIIQEMLDSLLDNSIPLGQLREPASMLRLPEARELIGNIVRLFELQLGARCNLSPRGEFETEQEYDSRMTISWAVQAQLLEDMREHLQEMLEGKEGYFAISYAKIQEEMDSLRAPLYILPRSQYSVRIKQYDLDRSRFPAEIDAGILGVFEGYIIVDRHLGQAVRARESDLQFEACCELIVLPTWNRCGCVAPYEPFLPVPVWVGIKDPDGIIAEGLDLRISNISRRIDSEVKIPVPNSSLMGDHSAGDCILGGDNLPYKVEVEYNTRVLNKYKQWNVASIKDKTADETIYRLFVNGKIVWDLKIQKMAEFTRLFNSWTTRDCEISGSAPAKIESIPHWQFTREVHERKFNGRRNVETTTPGVTCRFVDEE